MAGKVEVRVKDGGHSITIEGKELRGDISIIVDETDNIRQLRKSGLIATKPYQQVEMPKIVKHEPPAATPEDNSTGNTGTSEQPPEHLPGVVQAKPEPEKPPRNRNNRNRNTMRT